jgi:hypothetical protein
VFPRLRRPQTPRSRPSPTADAGEEEEEEEGEEEEGEEEKGLDEAYDEEEEEDGSDADAPPARLGLELAILISWIYRTGLRLIASRVL